MVLTDAESNEAVSYQGPMKYDQIKKFLSKYSY